MSGVLVVAETRRDELREASLEAVGAGARVKERCGGPLRVAIVHPDPGRFATALSVEGVDELLLVSSPVEEFEPEVSSQAVGDLIQAEQPALVLVPHSIDGMGFAPALAARLALGFASDVSALEWDDGPLATRGAFGGKLETLLDFPGKATTLLMLRAGAYPPAGGQGAPAVRSSETSAQPRSEHLRFEERPPGEIDITKVDFLLAVGRGIEEEDNLPRFEQLAERLGGTLGVSRPLVDAGWAAQERQVGQSGRTVKPKVYLALGISGAVQHLAGMRDAETVIAVNTDPEAPIFGVAHYGAVADLFEVADALEKRFP
jgi:electron transfer flavoprotein alpha subunit